MNTVNTGDKRSLRMCGVFERNVPNFLEDRKGSGRYEYGEDGLHELTDVNVAEKGVLNWLPTVNLRVII